jgi:hypothetical protein
MRNVRQSVRTILHVGARVHSEGNPYGAEPLPEPDNEHGGCGRRPDQKHFEKR